MNFTGRAKKQNVGLWVIFFFAMVALFGIGSSQCSAFCTYTYSGRNRIDMCGNSLSTSCTACDTTYFQLVGSNCLAHNRFGEYLDVNYTIDSSWLGQNGGVAHLLAYNGESTLRFCGYIGNSWATKKLPISFPHWAVRVRFFILWDSHMSMSLSYAVDDKSTTYNPNGAFFDNSWDIETGSRQLHQAPSATVEFNVNSMTCCTGCCCGNCLASSCYDCNILIKDVMLFVSRCQDGCMNCDQTRCGLCGINSLGLQTYLNDVDGICYSLCPQTTYKSTRLFLNDAVANKIEYFCASCDPKCLECTINSTYCSKCFPEGRNESFWFNNTCLFVCIAGFVPELQGHTCVCPKNYSYQINISLVFPLFCGYCSPQCLTCFGPTNLECTSCVYGYFQPFSTTNCETQCPTGQYSFNLTMCSLCGPFCASCVVSPSICTSCFFSTQMKYLLGSDCLSVCPDGYQMNNITFTCDPCSIFTFSFQGRCLPSCPKWYLPVEGNHSCVAYSQTNLNQSWTLVSVSVLPDGKSLGFLLAMSDGLSSASLDYLSRRAYFDITIIYVSPPAGRLLQSSLSLQVNTVSLSGSQIYLTTNIVAIVPHSTFLISFAAPIFSQHGLNYSYVSNSYKTDEHPQVSKQYFASCLSSLYSVVAIPFICILVVIILLRLPGMYPLHLETLKLMQMMGLLADSLFPVTSQLYFLMVGLDYCNLSFLPNLYDLFVVADNSITIESYLLTTTDMNFIRTVGSVLTFMGVWLMVLGVGKYLLKLKKEDLIFAVQLGVDLVEVRILFAFWVSIINMIMNPQALSFSIYLALLVAFSFFLVLAYRHYNHYTLTTKIPYFYLMRLLLILLICISSFAPLLLAFIIIVTAAFFSFMEFRQSIVLAQQYSFKDLTKYNYDSVIVMESMEERDDSVVCSLVLILKSRLNILLPFLLAFLIGSVTLLKETPLAPIIIVLTAMALLQTTLIALNISMAVMLNALKQKLQKHSKEEPREETKENDNFVLNLQQLRCETNCSMEFSMMKNVE